MSPGAKRGASGRRAAGSRPAENTQAEAAGPKAAAGPKGGGRRRRVFDAAREEVKERAWRQIAESGLPSLSLRGIAREMEMTAPALYRYFPNREALVAELVKDAFASFADAIDAARSPLPAEDHVGRLRAIALAYREWAITHPQRYILIFGTPVPPHKPGGRFEPISARSFAILVEETSAVYSATGLRPGGDRPKLTKALLKRLQGVKAAMGLPHSPEVIHLAICQWARIHGLVSPRAVRGASPIPRRSSGSIL